MGYKSQHVLWYMFFHLSWRKVAVLESYVGIMREMEKRTEHSLVRFKQCATIEFLTA
jgi:hypothetical protein